MRTRARVKGRRGGEVEHFARIPVSVLESEAVTTLSHAAFRVLVILASQYRGRNNGALALTARYARRFGFTGRDTLYRSLRELEQRGLIVCTRRGMKVKNLFSLYALGWADIDNRDGQPLAKPEPRDNSRWLNWRKSVPMAGNEAAEIHTDHRESSAPMAGNGVPVSVPMAATSGPLSVPTIGNTLRVSAGSGRERARNAGAHAAPDSAHKVRALLASVPTLEDADIARMLKLDPATVAQIRRSLASGSTPEPPRSADQL